MVEVGVALRRPPRTDEFRRYAIEASGGNEAELVACQIAQCTSVMATESVVVEWGSDGQP